MTNRNRLLAWLCCVMLLTSVVGCGGTKIVDYDEAAPIPDVPLAGGGSDTETAAGGEAPVAGNTSTAQGEARDQRHTSDRARRAEDEALPTKTAEFD